MKTIEEFTARIDGDVNKAKALVGLCYGLGLVRCYYGDNYTLEETIAFVDDGDSDYRYLIIGGSSIDMSNIEYDTNFDTMEEVFDYLVEELKTTVVKLNDDYDAIIKEDGIEVGCQFITYEKLEEVMEAAGYEFQ